jgi:hypothetical protein
MKEKFSEYLEGLKSIKRKINLFIKNNIYESPSKSKEDIELILKLLYKKKKSSNKKLI